MYLNMCSVLILTFEPVYRFIFLKKRVRKSLIFIKNRYLSPSGKFLRVTLQKNEGRNGELLHFLT